MFSKNQGELFENIAFYLRHPSARRIAVITTGGFTIVELLIVIVVIGILAAIVIVAYNGIQDRALDTSVKADIVNFRDKIGVWQAQNGYYPLYTQLTSADGIKINKNIYTAGGNNNWYYCVSSDKSRFAVAATAKSSRAGFVYDSATGLQANSGVYVSTACPSSAVTDPYYGGTLTSLCVWTSGACVWQSWVN